MFSIISSVPIEMLQDQESLQPAEDKGKQLVQITCAQQFKREPRGLNMLHRF